MIVFRASAKLMNQCSRPVTCTVWSFPFLVNVDSWTGCSAGYQISSSGSEWQMEVERRSDDEFRIADLVAPAERADHQPCRDRHVTGLHIDRPEERFGVIGGEHVPRVARRSGSTARVLVKECERD